jgi:hypothetical protein
VGIGVGGWVGRGVLVALAEAWLVFSGGFFLQPVKAKVATRIKIRASGLIIVREEKRSMCRENSKS